MAITKSPTEKSDAGSKAAAATTRASSPLADNRREGVVVDKTESDNLQASMRTIMAMKLRTDSNMEEVQAEVEEARRERDVIMQLLTNMREEQRRLAATLGLSGRDRAEMGETGTSPAAVAGPRAGARGGGAEAVSAAGVTAVPVGSGAAAVPAGSGATTGPGGGAAATTVGQAAVERVGSDTEGPRNGPGLLPTPTGEEIAAIRGKAKMPGYDNVVQNPCFNPMGSQPMEREMGRVQRAGSGFDRAGGEDRGMVNRSGPNGRIGLG
ncbi:unnamed protein product [Linum trigynum]|uniref:Uncharacterized protein n=1 Tax=Linum trigynum TaxID=586398 RepID=A0AAV2G0K5_9ROSI